VTTTTAAPTTAAEFEEFIMGLDTPEKFGEAFKNGTFGDKVKAYATAENAERRDITAQIREGVQATIAQMARDGEIGDTKTANARLDMTGKGGKHNKRAPGAGLDGKYADMGEFVQTVWHKRVAGEWRPPNNKDLNDFLEFQNAYQEKVPSDGGFLVPEEFRSEIITASLETAIVRPRATVISMGTNTLSFPVVDATSNVSSVYGGIIVYRTEEGEEFVESQAKFGRIKLDVTKQTALAYVTNETIKDTNGALMSWLSANLPNAMAWYEDLDYLTGSGAGEPLGALSAANPGLIVVAKETGQDADTIVWENALRMYARVLPSSIGKAVWVASQDTFVELATMALQVGTGGSAVWLTDAHGTPVLTLLGRPVIMTEKAPGVLGTQGDLSLVDFSMYYIGDRESMSMDTSAHVKFTSDQTTIRVIQRNDGRPAMLSAVTPQNNGPTLSAFVQLDDRA
jgi:HK97 family phage major capsid protein